MSRGLTITDEKLEALLAAHVAAVLPAATLEAMARARVDERIGQVTLDEAARLFGRPSRRAMLEFCRKHRIEVLEYSREDRWIRLSEIERVQGECAVVLPGKGEGTGTRVGKTERPTSNVQRPTSNGGKIVAMPVAEPDAIGTRQSKVGNFSKP